MGPIIDITNLFPWRILTLFAYSVAFFNIYKAVLKDKFHPIITFLTIFTARIITSEIFFNKEPLDVLGYPVFALLCFIILLFLTEGKLYDKFFVIIISLISQFTAGAINSVVTITAIKGQTYEQVFGTENMNLDYLTLYLSSCIVFIIVGILFGTLLKLYNNRRSKNKNSKLLIYFSAFPVSHIMIVLIPMIFVPIELDNNYLGSTVYTVIYILFTIIMIFDCTFPLMINHFEKIIEKNNKYEKDILKNKMDYNQMLMLKQEKNEFRKLKHDFANIITTAKGFIEIDKPEKALSILSNTNDDLLGLAGFSICSNETINTIIYIKQQQAERNNINLSVEITEDCPVYIDDYDLCRILHNIIDNSLNAVSLLNENKNSRINIEINDEQIIIKSENRYNKDNKIKRLGEHGNGIGIIKETASKYGGKYTYKQLNGVWYTETYLGNKKSANSTPPPPNFGLTEQL